MTSAYALVLRSLNIWSTHRKLTEHIASSARPRSNYLTQTDPLPASTLSKGCCRAIIDRPHGETFAPDLSKLQSEHRHTDLRDPPLDAIKAPEAPLRKQS